MPQLIQIADFQFIALKDDIDITEQDRKRFTSMSLKNKYFSSKVVEVPTSLALLSEFEKCPFTDDNFVNDLDSQTPQITKTNDFVYIGPSYSVKNAEIPLLMQKAGLKIKREQSIAYLAPGTNPEEPYILVNQDGTPFENPERNACGRANKLNIDIYDDVLALRPDEYEKYLYTKKLIDAGKIKEVSEPDLYLYGLTEAFITKYEKLDVVFHEMRHAQNALILFDYLLNNPKSKLSALDIFKQEQNDELSAKLAEAIQAINTYNQSKDKNNLSVFESSYILQQLLYDKTPTERELILSNIPYIVGEVCIYWYKNFAMNYKPQFIRNTSIKLGQIPLKHLTDESDGTSYNDIRKLMFAYNVYDTKTGQYTNMDLSKYIIDFGVNESDFQMTQQMYQNEVVKERQQILNAHTDAIQPDIINAAQQKYTKLVNETQYRQTLTNLQNAGMDYMSALNFIPGVTDTTNKTHAQPKENPPVAPHQPNEAKSENQPTQNLNLFQKAARKIKEKFFPRQFLKTNTDNLDYE